MDAPKGLPEGGLDQLYHGPLEEFTPLRTELAKSLRSEGYTEAAERVRRLKKPTRAAWLVDQLSVRKADEIAELLAAGEELRAAQEEMLAGATDREKLRDAAAREQRLIGALTGSAEAIGAEHGVGAAILTRVTETLQAASSDPDVAEGIRRGWLEREQRAASIGLVGPAAPGPKSQQQGAKAREAAGRKKREQQARRRKRAEQKPRAARHDLDAI